MKSIDVRRKEAVVRLKEALNKRGKQITATKDEDELKKLKQTAYNLKTAIQNTERKLV